jgi:RNA polymerase sigma factor (sigma-70 family)
VSPAAEPVGRNGDVYAATPMSSEDASPTIETLLAHRAWVRGIARALVADESRVDDVEQETWLVAMDRPPSSVGAVRAWLRRVVRSRAVDAHRSESRRAAREHAAARPEGLPATADLVAKAEIQRDVAAAVCALAEPYRTAILLRHFEELEPREIAARLGVPVETVRTRIKRGHERLRELLDEEHGDAPLARGKRGIPAATAAGGALVMAGTKKVVAVAVLVLAVAGGAWWAAETASSPEGGAASAEPVLASAAAPRQHAKAESPATDASPAIEPGTTVTVEVVDTAGGAVTGARAELARAAPVAPGLDNFDEWLLAFAPSTVGAPRIAQTSDAGRADVAGIAPGAWRLRVSAANHADHEETVAVQAAPVSRRIVLQDACPLAGTVSGADGSPAGDVTVVVGSQRTTSDAAGRYRFGALPAGVHDVRVGERDVVQKFATVRLPEVAHLDIRLRGGCELAGRGVDDATGAPVPGARLRLFGFAVDDLPTWHEFVASAVSAEDGRFAMPDLPSGAMSGLRATHPEYAANQRGLDRVSVQAHLAPGYPMTVEVRMKRGGVVIGHVTTEERAPVAGATVEVVTRTGGSWIDVSDAAATDANGAFRVRAACGRGLVRVRAAGLLQRDFPADPWTAVRNDAIPPNCAVTVDERIEAAIDVIVVRGAAVAGDGAISGTVRREDGAPTSDVLLELVPPGSDDESAMVGTVSANGGFRFTSLAPGKYRLRASAEGCASARLDALVVPETGDLEGVEVVLTREATITGCVRDAGGEPVGSARIDVGPQRDDAAASAMSAANGAFVVRRLAPGDWSLTVRAPGFATGYADKVAAGTSEVEVRLDRALSISGVVVDAATGDPIAAMPVQASYATHRQGYILYREVATDAAGRFVVSELCPETYTLWVGRANDASSAAEYVGTSVPDVRAGATDVRVKMARGLAIEGRVVDAAGDPVPGGFIQAMGPKAGATPALAVRGARIGRDGTFRLSGLATGAYDLSASPQSADGADASPVRAPDVQAGANDVVLRTSEGLTISGRLLLEDGKPLPQSSGSVQVRWKNDLGGLSWQELGMMWSADGSFRTGALEPERLYDLVVEGIPGRLGATVRGIKPGTKDLVVTVRDGGRISGRVVDASGAPVPAGVGVSANSDARPTWPATPGQHVYTTTDAEGRFTLSGLADTNYQLFAGGNASDFVQTQVEKRFAPGSTGVEIRVERGVSIAGRVVDAKGVALKGGVVDVRGQGDSEVAPIDEQGRFAIRGLKPGTHRISALLGKRTIDLGEVQAPADGLVLTVRDE